MKRENNKFKKSILVALAIIVSSNLFSEHVFRGKDANGSWTHAASWSPEVPTTPLTTDALFFRCDGDATYNLITYDASHYSSAAGIFTVDARVAVGLYKGFTLNIPSGEVIFTPSSTASGDADQTIIGFSGGDKSSQTGVCVVNLTGLSSQTYGAGKLTLSGVRDAIIGHSLNNEANRAGKAVINISDEAVFNCSTDALRLGYSKNSYGRIIAVGSGAIELSSDVTIYRNGTTATGAPNPDDSYISLSGNATFKHDGKDKAYYEGLVISGLLRKAETIMPNFDAGFEYDDNTGIVTAKATTPLFANDDSYTVEAGIAFPGGNSFSVRDNDLIPISVSAVLITPPQFHSGSFTLNTDGSFNYTRLANATYGVDKFTYRLEGTTENSNEATVYLNAQNGGLISHWKFDEVSGVSAKDLSPRGNTGNIIGSPDWENGSFVFDGFTNITMSSPDIDLYGLVIEFYIPDEFTATTENQTLIQYGTNARQHAIVLGGNTTGYLANETFTIVTNNGSTRTGLNETIRAGSHQMIINWDTTTSKYRIYLDGIEKTAIHNSGGAGLISSNAFILGGSTASYGYFTGKIDDVKIYSRPITESELSKITSPVIGFESSVNGSTLIWTIEEEIGVKEYIIKDTSGNVIATVVADGSNSYSIELPEGITDVVIEVVDTDGSSQTYAPEDGNRQVTFYDLEKGWNLIAITSDNADLSELENVASGAIWAWNEESYTSVESAEATNAVWVYMNSAKQVKIIGVKSDATINLSSGWNLVGPVENIHIPEKVLSTYSWNSNSEMYQNITKDSILQEGVGYWIFSF